MIHRLSEVRDTTGQLTHKMCCICFEFVPVEDLWRDEGGQRWDMCVPCGETEKGAAWRTRG